VDVVAIVNPVAGRKHGIALRTRALPELIRVFPGIRLLETLAPGHATALARDHARADLVIAVGGDGTFREVATGLVGTDTTMAIVPTGSGNDFPRTVGIPSDTTKACRAARDGMTRHIDMARLQVEHNDAVETSHFINAAGFGFDARVVAETRKSKRLSGLPLYMSAVFRAIRDNRSLSMHLRVDDREWDKPVLLVAIANGRYYGGGMRIAPGAEPDDGRLDICIIDAIPRRTIVRRLPDIVRGTHVKLKEVTTLRAARLDLEFDAPPDVQLDGDLLDVSGSRKFTIQVLPGALKLIVPSTPD
jgi:YegS/Rv2252/BmrU family lipid kinase